MKEFENCIIKGKNGRRRGNDIVLFFSVLRRMPGFYKKNPYYILCVLLDYPIT